MLRQYPKIVIISVISRTILNWQVKAMDGLGKRIRTMRNRKGMTQKQLAERSNITVAAISRYENGLRCPMSDILANIARALNISTDYLLMGEEKPDQERSLEKIIQIICMAGEQNEITPYQQSILAEMAKEAFSHSSE